MVLFIILNYFTILIPAIFLFQIMKLSVLTDSNDLGNSVRRVIGRMVKDDVLVKYSLFGFKKKQCFSSLLSYRLIIGKNLNFKYLKSLIMFGPSFPSY